MPDPDDGIGFHDLISVWSLWRALDCSSESGRDRHIPLSLEHLTLTVSSEVSFAEVSMASTASIYSFEVEMTLIHGWKNSVVKANEAGT